MNRFIPHYFDLLKKELLVKCGIKRVSASDCKHVSEELFRATKKYVSETTLKRLFGFAYSTFNPSSFTLNTLADYCGYDGWDDFCAKAGNYQADSETGVSELWQKVMESAERITFNTLQVLKARSGIPYEKTIARKFLAEHLDIFLSGSYNATLLFAPADYGKTIALCHWVDQHIKNNINKPEKDVILFFSHNVLQNPSMSNRNLNDWIRALLGIYGDEEISGLREGPANNTRLILVIDGIDEYKHRNETYDVLNQIIDVVSLYRDNPWLKIIISVRSYVWVNNKHRVSMVGQRWFEGFITTRKGNMNVPLLNHEEVVRIANGLSFEKQNSLDPGILEFFSYPTAIQFHYQNNPSSFTLNKVDEFSYFEVVSAYFLHRIFRSKNSHDLMQLLVGLMNEVDLTSQEFNIPKLKVATLIKENQSAFHELLSSGILQEYNVSENSGLRSYVTVSYVNAVKRLYARKILDEAGRFGPELIERYNQIPDASALKPDILKWLIYLCVSGGQTCDLQLLDNTSLTINERSRLLVFYSQLISKYSGASEGAFLGNIVEKNGDSLLGLEYINKNYEQALETLLDVPQFRQHHLTIRVCLGVISILHLDLKKLSDQINILRALDQEPFLEYPINPLYCLETVYYYLKFGTIKEAGFRILTKFYFNPPTLWNDVPGNFREVLQLFGLYTLLISKNNRKSDRFVRALNRVYPTGSTGYVFLRDVFHIESLIRSGHLHEAKDLFNHLTKRYRKAPNGSSSFMMVSYYSIKLIIDSLDRAPKHEQIDAFIQLCDESEYNLTKVRALAELLKNPHVKSNEILHQKLSFELIKTSRMCECIPESFLA